MKKLDKFITKKKEDLQTEIDNLDFNSQKDFEKFESLQSQINTIEDMENQFNL